MNWRNVLGTACLAGATIFSAGCGDGAKAGKPSGPPPALVSVMEVKPEDVAVYSDYPAQTFARDMVEVRGRVDGFIQKRLFAVGSDVQKNQILYELDRRPYQADVAKASGDVRQSQANVEFAKNQVALLQAQADLAQAEANLAKSEQDVKRLEPLVKEEAAAQQDLDNARAALKANQANVEARKANVQQTRLSTAAQIDTTAAQVESNKALLRGSELNLEYATIRAPIGGRIGDSLIPVGGLVSKASATPLTTIVPLDPIWVRFKVSESEYLGYQNRKGPSGNGQHAVLRIPLELILADGAVHPYPGHIQNTVNQVDQKTGTLELQATFPNPKHNLLPGQFGRVRFRNEERRGALLVPQRAVQETQGMQSVFVVSADNKVLLRSIVPGDRVGERWIVNQGLKPGDRVVVEGTMKIRPGMTVT
ncbi:MAG: efflux RND transporter periplasmic adaptor subunit, partial [Acidobacteriota bacterium]|nr:efflux RND transporter periplasmic adaptor subunit [Acidobacteriota bacterium]